MKTAYRTVSALRASAGPFIGIPMHAPTSPEYSQVFDLVYLIFGEGGGRSTSSY